MNKYFKVEDVINKYAEMIASEDWWKYGVDDFKVDKDSIDKAKKFFADIPIIEIDEEKVEISQETSTINERGIKTE